MLLCTISDNQLMKNTNWLCKNAVPSKWKYWMTLHIIEFGFSWIGFIFLNWIQLQWMEFEFHFNSFQVNSINFFDLIQLKRNGMKIYKKGIEKYPWIWGWKKKT